MNDPFMKAFECPKHSQHGTVVGTITGEATLRLMTTCSFCEAATLQAEIKKLRAMMEILEQEHPGLHDQLMLRTAC